MATFNEDRNNATVRLERRALYTAVFPRKEETGESALWNFISGLAPRKQYCLRTHDYNKLPKDQRAHVYCLDDDPVVFLIALAFNIKPKNLAEVMHRLKKDATSSRILNSNLKDMQKILLLKEEGLTECYEDVEIQMLKGAVFADFGSPVRMKSLDDLNPAVKKVLEKGRQIVNSEGMDTLSDRVILLLAQRRSEPTHFRDALKCVHQFNTDVITLCSKSPEEIFDTQKRSELVTPAWKAINSETPHTDTESEDGDSMRQWDRKKNIMVQTKQLTLEDMRKLDQIEDPDLKTKVYQEDQPEEWLSKIDILEDDTDDPTTPGKAKQPEISEEYEQFVSHIELERTLKPTLTTFNIVSDDIDQIQDNSVPRGAESEVEPEKSKIPEGEKRVTFSRKTKQGLEDIFDRIMREQNASQDSMGWLYCFLLRRGVRCDTIYQTEEQFDTHVRQVHSEDISNQNQSPEDADTYENGIPIISSGVDLDQYFTNPTPGGDHGQLYVEGMCENGSFFECYIDDSNECGSFNTLDEWRLHLVQVHTEYLRSVPDHISDGLPELYQQHKVMKENSASQFLTNSRFKQETSQAMKKGPGGKQEPKGEKKTKKGSTSKGQSVKQTQAKPIQSSTSKGSRFEGTGASRFGNTGQEGKRPPNGKPNPPNPPDPPYKKVTRKYDMKCPYWKARPPCQFTTTDNDEMIEHIQEHDSVKRKHKKEERDIDERFEYSKGIDSSEDDREAREQRYHRDRSDTEDEDNLESSYEVIVPCPLDGTQGIRCNKRF